MRHFLAPLLLFALLGSPLGGLTEELAHPIIKPVAGSLLLEERSFREDFGSLSVNYQGDKGNLKTAEGIYWRLNYVLAGMSRDEIKANFTQAVLAEEKPALTALSLLISEQINFQIREKKGMAYGISSGIEILGNQALFYLRLGTRPENIETLSKIWPGFFRPDVLKDVDKAAFEKAINKYLGRMSFRRLSSINQGFYLGKSLYQESDPFYFEKLLERIAQLDLSAVQKTAAKYLSPENSSELIVRPSKP